MAKNFNQEETDNYFTNRAGVFSNVACCRDDIFLDIILPKCKEELGDKIKLIDFGCGGGKLLVKLNDMGIDAYGIERNENLYSMAKERMLRADHEESRIIKGGIEELRKLDPKSIDVVLLMGVFQYLSPEDYEGVFGDIHDVLRDDGHLVGSFQNALFDFFNLNRYTMNFYKENFIKPLGVDKLLGEEVYKDLETLITNPNKPEISSVSAIDNVYVRTTNPITIDKELKEKNFELIGKYFFDLYFVPRLIEKKYEAALTQFKKEFEVKRSTEWFGYFMANAFLTHSVKI
ncbi:MAG: class I SAM-dependent methyltransferase [Nanoarchaeota archaeon]